MKQKIERWAATLWRLPFVFRAASTLLIVSAAAGAWWQHQPAGSGTYSIIAFVEKACPAAHLAVAHPTIADGAHALDRMAGAIARSRCGGAHPEHKQHHHGRQRAADRTSS